MTSLKALVSVGSFCAMCRRFWRWQDCQLPISRANSLCRFDAALCAVPESGRAEHHLTWRWRGNNFQQQSCCPGTQRWNLPLSAPFCRESPNLSQDGVWMRAVSVLHFDSASVRARLNLQYLDVLSPLANGRSSTQVQTKSSLRHRFLAALC